MTETITLFEYETTDGFDLTNSEAGRFQQLNRSLALFHQSDQEVFRGLQFRTKTT
jgi:hypothetical protein